jgi:hypothetical protein
MQIGETFLITVSDMVDNVDIFNRIKNKIDELKTTDTYDIRKVKIYLEVIDE